MLYFSINWFFVLLFFSRSTSNFIHSSVYNCIQYDHDVHILFCVVVICNIYCAASCWFFYFFFNFHQNLWYYIVTPSITIVILPLLHLVFVVFLIFLWQTKFHLNIAYCAWAQIKSCTLQNEYFETENKPSPIDIMMTDILRARKKVNIHRKKKICLFPFMFIFVNRQAHRNKWTKQSKTTKMSPSTSINLPQLFTFFAF